MSALEEYRRQVDDDYAAHLAVPLHELADAAIAELEAAIEELTEAARFVERERDELKTINADLIRLYKEARAEVAVRERMLRLAAERMTDNVWDDSGPVAQSFGGPPMSKAEYAERILADLRARAKEEI